MNPQISHLISALRLGKMALLIDDLTTPSCGFVIQASSFASTESVAFLADQCKGVICAALSPERAAQLGLVIPNSQLPHTINMTNSVEARHNVTTGISAADRAETLKTLATTVTPNTDLVVPGHIFPILTERGGALVRSLPWEASVDLLRLSDLPEVCTIAHCLTGDGDVANLRQLRDIAQQHGLLTIAISDIIRYRLATDIVVEQITSTILPTSYAGEFIALSYIAHHDNSEHLVLVKNPPDTWDKLAWGKDPVLVRIQSEDKLQDLFGPPAKNSFSQRTLVRALQRIEEEKQGLLVYIRHPQGCRIANGLSPQPSQNQNVVELRYYGLGLQILRSLGLSRIRLLSNSSGPPIDLGPFDIEVTNVIALGPFAGRT